MMIETSIPPVPVPTMETAAEAPESSTEAPASAEGSSTSGEKASEEASPAAAPAPAPAPRKTWGVPKAPPKGSEPKKKKTLMEIMEEEQKAEQAKKEADEANRVAQQKQLEQRLLQEEEAALMQAMQASMATSEPVDMDGMDEDMKLALMLSMQDQPQSDAKLPPQANDTKMPPAAAAASIDCSSEIAASASASAPVAVAAAASAPSSSEDNGLTEEEMKEIEKALMEADASESAKTDAESLRLALELQHEEDGKLRAQQNLKKGPQGNVRTVSRADFLREKGQDQGDDDYYNHQEDDDHARYMDEYDDLEENGAVEAGYRINSTKQSAWARADGGGTIRGLNGELKTKHDTKLQGQANAYRLELRANDTTGNRAHVGNKAFNDFHRSMQKKTVKGVAAHGHGRATADADKTRDGALDGRVRLQIARAVNNGLIEAFHGCVKEGKEALVFHAQQGANSEGFDVAVKVFKRISEFRNRGQYVAGDPRYKDGKDFKYAGARQQVELWAEKENRNLLRAYRAKVPVPKPLWYKENVLFLRFLGEEGWPSPQLRELDMKKGSKKWTALYEQTMEAMQLLYCDARLVHGDLSEYNIMVCPERFLQRFDDDEEGAEESEDSDEKTPAAAATEKEDKEGESTEEKPAAAATEPDETKAPAAIATENQESQAKPATKFSITEPAPAKGTGDALQVALIDFGQAVDLRHPEAEELLRRDITRVKEFFDRQAITTVSVEVAMAYVQTKGALMRG